MDPVATLGLAANVVQFVEFSWKLWIETKDLYESSTGTSAENDDLATISRDLIELDDALTSTAGAVPDQMTQLATQCREVSCELLEIIEKLRVDGPPRKWKSFVAATQSVWKKNQIEGLINRMERLRNQVQLRLTWVLSYPIALSLFTSGNMRLINTLGSEGNRELHSRIADVIAENKRLGTEERQQLGSQLRNVHTAMNRMQEEHKVLTKALYDVQNSIPHSQIPPRHQENTIKAAADTTVNCASVVDPDTSARLSSRMLDLSRQLSDLSRDVGSPASNQMLLRSLHFNNVSDRQISIAASHEKTFRWIFDQSLSPCFVQWLRSESGIAWIKGKAGSGKSTLMKFLVTHAKTVEHLKIWAGSRKLISASFYFWNAGTGLQKSQEGLFRSLLYEILRQSPELIHGVCGFKLENFRPFTGELEPWTRQELWQAIGQLKTQTSARTRFCFFIDGLDEYDGEPDHIVEVLESLREWPDVKLCVSSRPWNEFMDAFSQETDFHLALEDFTRDDIKRYIQHTLEENSRFKLLGTRDERYQDLIQEIVSKARGVYLWVVIVVRSLLNGLSHADRIQDLQRRLREFPGTLEAYYRKMLLSVEGIYRQQLAEALTYRLTAAGPLSLLTYSFLDEENLDSIITSEARTLTEEDIKNRHDDMRRRLNGRCRGFLEVIDEEISQASYGGPVLYPKVDFIHRTAYDFLLTKDMQKLLAENLNHEFEPKLNLCKAYLAQLKSLDLELQTQHNFSEAGKLLEDLVFYAQGLEHDLGLSPSMILDEARRVSEDAPYFHKLFGECGFLYFAIQRGLDLYVAEVLSRTSHTSSLNMDALLAGVLDPMKQEKYRTQRSDSKTIEMLVERGASPQRLLNDVIVRVYKVSLTCDYTGVGDFILQLAKTLLHLGANPWEEVLTQGLPTGPGQILSRGTADLESPIVSGVASKNAYEVFKKFFGEKKTANVFD